jgi:hypothetical protein
MKLNTPLFCLLLALMFMLWTKPAAAADSLGAEGPMISPGDTVYTVDPLQGDDSHPAGQTDKPWRTFAKINALRLAAGDTVVIAPGRHELTLKPVGEGRIGRPVTLRFLPGVHSIGGRELLRVPLFVSNSQDSTDAKPVGLCFQDLRHFRVEGGGVAGPGKTTLLYDGRLVQVLNERVEDITFAGLVFDLKRPTVSEFRVMESGPAWAVIEVAEGSAYEVEKERFLWRGDWGRGHLLCQQAVPAEGRAWRARVPRGWTSAGQAEAAATELGGRRVRLDFPGGETGLEAGRQYQFRHATRDSVGVHNARSKDIVFRDCDFYALTNMGFVSQFTENITYQRVNVAPPAGSLRTCAAWADIFQFSNCRGDLLVEDCRLSGMQDDAINVHGTHLRIVGRPEERQLLVRFMHKQTYGFAAFAPGDEVAVISHVSLREYAGNPRRRVVAVERRTDKDWLLTFDGSAPAYEPDDVVDNITWHPNLIARRNHVSLSPVRGFLITTRGRVVVEDNVFERCAMPAILVENDAEGWFESGPVRDLLIRRNRFVGSGIVISPHTKTLSPDAPVHENIRIVDNRFESIGGKGVAVEARGVKGLVITGNMSRPGPWAVKIDPSCADARVENNR